MRKLHKKGFTLIETVVVVVIIGILSAATVPKLLQQQARARDVKRLHDIREIGNAMFLYKVDKNHFPSFQDAIPNFNENSTYWQLQVNTGSNAKNIYYNQNRYGTNRWLCYFDTTGPGTSALNNGLNGVGDCSSTIMIEDQLAPKYLTKLPRSPKPYVLGVRDLTYNRNVWFCNPSRDANGVENPTDYYNYMILPKGPMKNGGMLLSVPMEVASNNNWMALGMTGSLANLSQVMQPQNWNNRGEVGIISAGNQLFWGTAPTNRTLEKIVGDTCKNVQEIYMNPAVPLHGLDNSGTCYLPNNAPTPWTQGTTVTNKEQHLRYLYVQ